MNDCNFSTQIITQYRNFIKTHYFPKFCGSVNTFEIIEMENHKILQQNLLKKLKIMKNIHIIASKPELSSMQVAK